LIGIPYNTTNVFCITIIPHAFLFLLSDCSFFDYQAQDDDEVPRIPTPENPLTIEGHTEKDHLYHGPPFPPEHPPLPSNVNSGVLEADDRVNDALEDRAVEWYE
jgi:hypothetical protein